MSGADPVIFKKKGGGGSNHRYPFKCIDRPYNRGCSTPNLPVDPPLHVFDLTVPYEQAC